METTRKDVAMDTLNIGGDLPKRVFPVVTDGVYEAEFIDFRVGMENSPWGEKQVARINFSIVKGPFAKSRVTFKSNFFHVQDTNTWIIPSKSNLAEVIRVITGGKGALGKTFVGTRVFVNVGTRISKSKGEKYSFVDKVMAMPAEYAAPAPAPAPTIVPQAAPAAQPQVVKPAPQATPTPTPVAKAQPTQAPDNDALLEDLTKLADYDL